MIFYDWKLVHKKALGKSGHIIDIISVILRKSNGEVLAKSKRDPMYKWYNHSFVGTSYLLNASDLLKNRYQYKDRDIATYIGLAAFRNFAEYKITKDTTLNLRLSPITAEHSIIRDNPLLEVDGDTMHFKYEKRKK